MPPFIVRLAFCALIVTSISAELHSAGLDKSKMLKFELTVPGIDAPVVCYYSNPDGFDPSQMYPVHFIIPGDYKCDKPIENTVLNGIDNFSPGGFSTGFINASVYYSKEIGCEMYDKWNGDNGRKATDAMIRHIMETMPVDPERVFITAFANGNFVFREMVKAWGKTPPVAFAGVAYIETKQACPDVTSPCFTEKTRVFVGTDNGDGWARQMGTKCKNVEAHVTDYSPAKMVALSGEWATRVMKELNDEAIDAVIKNAKNALAAVRAAKYGEAWNLSSAALKLDSDNADFKSAKTIALFVKSRFDYLKSEVESKITEDPSAAFGVLIAMEKLFDNCEYEDWASAEIKRLTEESKEMRAAHRKASSQSKKWQDAEKEKAKTDFPK